MTMQIIDFEKKGNVVRFYLGDASQPYWGDDWNDAPYDCNAGTVYEKYIKGYKDIAFPFDDLVLEPCDGTFFNVDVSKEDMMHRAVPCIIAVPYAVCKDAPWDEDFQHWIGAEGVQKYYFGDEIGVEQDAVHANSSWAWRS